MSVIAAAAGPPTFDLLGELPSGTTILDASAGTGKTYAIAGLAVRYVVEADVPLPSLLVVTFTRAATAELRDRVRDRLVATTRHLARVLDGAPTAHRDPVIAHLSMKVDRDELAARHTRAARAVADFDAATIATIHGFCQQVLRALGFAVGADPDATLLPDQRELVTAVVDDLLVQVATRHDVAELSRSSLLEIAQKVVANPDARIVPDPTAADTIADDGATTDGTDDRPDLAALRAEVAHRTRTELVRRKRLRRVLSYDDLLTQLRDALVDPDQGESAAAGLRSRYQVALIDEFQDTDPVQWEIVRRAFGGPSRTLVLIGDPKQAIYSFRGADVYAYLDAVEVSDVRYTLETNWRSDGPLLHALDTLLTGATFGDPRIPYRSVRPAPGHEHARLTGAVAPLRLRHIPRSHRLRSSRGDVNAGAAREHIAADLAAQAVALVAGDLRIAVDAAEPAAGSRPVGAGDLAVLVRTNVEAVQIHRALRDVQVPAIINGVGSVFQTPAATEWQRLLEALEQPTNSARARAATLTSFIGWTGDDLAHAVVHDDEMAAIHDRIHAWAALLRDRGIAALLRTIMVQTDLTARLLGTVGGERHLTDLDHLSQMLHRAAVDDHLGTAALTSWLIEAIGDADDEQVPAEERARRLESDDQAVQILTVHRSKGLEYPIVFAPYLWSPGWLHPSVPIFHDDAGRAIDVGGKRDDEAWERHCDQARDEQSGENLRLLYVALTRAQHQVVVWWAPCQNANRSGLGRVLFARDLDGALDTTATGVVPSDARCRERLEAIAARSSGTMALEATDTEPSTARWQPTTVDTADLHAAVLDRRLDRAWQRTSYSRLTATAHQPSVTSEPSEDLVTDEALLPADETLPPADEPAPPADEPAPPSDATPADPDPVEVPLATTPGGAEFGTFVHAVLEHTDFAAADLPGELDARVRAELARRRTRIGDPAVLVEALARAIGTPLGPLVGGLRLRDIHRDDRIDELDFELPLDPGLHGGVTVARIGRLFREHLSEDDPLAGYGSMLAAPNFHLDVRGFLAGSIDLVVRTPGRDGRVRYVIADHKTNRLGTWDRPLTTYDYRPEALADAMQRGHYPLQALLYQVALHRYLRWRLADYHPDLHLGGALYLFLRGMVGADTPVIAGQPCGVFAWSCPPALVTATSDLLDGGGA